MVHMAMQTPDMNAFIRATKITIILEVTMMVNAVVYIKTQYGY